jgi:hypothetical protein
MAANQPILYVVVRLAAECGMTAAQPALAWLYDRGRAIGLPVVPSRGRDLPRGSRERRGWGIGLDSHVVAQLDSLAGRITGHRSAQPDWVSGQRGEPLPVPRQRVIRGTGLLRR